MTNILEQIIAHKQTEIASLDTPALRRAAEASPAPRDFLSAISARPIGEGLGVRKRRFISRPSLIAELKRASPPKGFSPRIWTSSKLRTFTLKMARLRSVS